MADCDADPSVMVWAKRYTHNPIQFENQLREVLPRLAYVQQIAAQYDVAGEFVLLPWVESQFQPVAARRRQPAGMWQIMPITAGAMGLRVDGHYDGRLDVPAAAHAVMKLLKQYHDQFHDWRVADYAYNAGEFSVRKLIRKHGMPGDDPVIPEWPVRKVTRAHLTKLLAIACVVREPGRFHVSLPTLPDEQQLVQVKITHSMPITRAADHAGMSVNTLKGLNAAFRSDMIDAGAASYLLLPASRAEQFRNALLVQPSMGLAAPQGHGTAAITAVSVPSKTTTPRKTHTVRRGDSLWQIARNYSVNVSELQRWNHLRGQTLKLGQVLRVSDTN
ncbi:LysM peptidoglycan-binding domain-containing protein [Rhodanobacter glycinis]|uniref:LysM peptidoglycan-binding domain-containing protein n=1 Tax=Rhodanobacter glycinis TaxID=582702 RepID=A0A502C008_9GAMM|nr:transglycosylase SLT domain-containing protein [Rhodanobacter glycinis]TPG05076.1 LysM peptidoglycan-binding domain-containing protein [Rhodanobacter glycinis]